MKDRFKFRVWCVNKKQWEDDRIFLDNYGRLYDVVHIVRVKEETHIIQQCTGLKDMNGKLIYEGDIIEWEKKNYIVIFDEINSTFAIKINDNMTRLFNDIGTHTLSIKVIGNIFQDSHLLEIKN